MHNRIREWRLRRGLSQAELGRRLGVGKATVSKLERGNLHLRDTMIARLVEVLDVPAGELLGDFAEPAETAQFGDRVVPARDKAGLVRAVFDRVAPRYDLMNDLMSLGVHRLWKDAMVDWLRPRGGQTVLDVAGGTGDIALRIAERTQGAARVVVCDANPAMLAIGRDRAIDRGFLDAIAWVAGDAERLPLADSCVDTVTIAFGIRNVTHIDRALAEARRVLVPGGRFLCLEFSRVTVAGLDRLYEAYAGRVLPTLGELVAGDRAAYEYLVESIRRFPDQDAFAGMIAAAGLARVRVRNLSGGIAALHSAWRL